MPSIDIDLLNKLDCNLKNYMNFIETGTYMGETVFCLEPYFSKLYTIEIKKEFYEAVINKYTGNKINFYHGDSSNILTKILPNISNKSIIFLDGHWSGGNTGKGTKDCPLYEELYNIVMFHKDEAIIIVDDVRLFGKGPNKELNDYDLCNWENISEKNILNIVKNRLVKKFFLPSNIIENDRLIIHISKKNMSSASAGIQYFISTNSKK